MFFSIFAFAIIVICFCCHRKYHDILWFTGFFIFFFVHIVKTSCRLTWHHLQQFSLTLKIQKMQCTTISVFMALYCCVLWVSFLFLLFSILFLIFSQKKKFFFFIDVKTIEVLYISNTHSKDTYLRFEMKSRTKFEYCLQIQEKL